MAILILRPNATAVTGDYLGQFPDTGEHYDKVNEETHDEDSTYVYWNKGWRIASGDFFYLPNHTIETEVITMVYVCVRARVVTPGDAIDLSPGVYINGQTYSNGYGWGGEITNTEYQDFGVGLPGWDKNPATNLPWTWEDIDNLGAGFWCGLTKSGNGLMYVTQCWVEVAYTGPVSKSIMDSAIGEELLRVPKLVKRCMSFIQFQRNSRRIN